MIRAAVLGAALVLCLVPCACLAQGEAQVAEEAEAFPEFGGAAPGAGALTVPGEAAVDLADFVAQYLLQTGMVPDYAQAESSSGELITLSAAEIFTLLARTAHLWRFTGALPEVVPVTPDEVSAPVLDYEDLVQPPGDEDAGKEIDTEQFLAVCPAVVRWIDRLQILPTSVYVDGQRLSASEYLAGLAICIGYAYWEGQLYDFVVLPAYAPPYSWVSESSYTEYTEAGWEEESAEVYESEWGAEEPYPEGEGQQPSVETILSQPRLPFSGAPQAAPTQAEPRLTIYPEPGTTVSGIVDLVASYIGPPAQFVVLTIDSQSEVIMNFPPYGYRWDTRDLEPGLHSVRIEVLGPGGSILADQMSAFFVIPPESEAPELDMRDDL